MKNLSGHGWPILVALVLAGPACYGVGLGASSIVDGTSIIHTVCFDPAAASHLTPFRLIVAAVTALGAVVFLFAVPWLLGTLAIARRQSKRTTAAAWSVAVNSAALVLVCFLLRETVGICRGSFFAGWLAWSVILAAWAGKPAAAATEIARLWRRWGPGLLIGLAAVAVGIIAFHREHFLQCFNGDGTEVCDLAQSLRFHLLPYWEVETIGRFGTFVANPTVTNSYWTLALHLLLGEGEPATRLPCWIWWLGVFAVSLRLVCGEDGRTPSGVPGWLPAVPLACALMLVSIWFTFYVGYYPYMADPASPAVGEASLTLFLLLAWYCLRQGDGTGWAVSMILASLIFYAGAVMLVLTAVAALIWRPLPRRQMLWATLVAATGLLTIAGGYLLAAWMDGSLEGWGSTFYREIYRKYKSPGAGGDLGPLFLGYFLLGCGVIPAIGLVRVFWRKAADHDLVCRDLAWDRTMATVTLAYLLIILGSGHKNLHYLGPLLPIPLILWLKQSQSAAPSAAIRWVAPLAASVGLVVVIALSWPASRPIFTLNRELGALTTFQTDDYEEACHWGRIAEKLYRQGHFGWQIGEHTWVDYSQWAAQPVEPRPLLVTDGQPPSDQYAPVGEAVDGVRLYSRDPLITSWARTQDPKAGPARCPKIFQPIAVSPRDR